MSYSTKLIGAKIDLNIRCIFLILKRLKLVMKITKKATGNASKKGNIHVVTSL